MLQIDCEQKLPVLIVRLSGELDLRSADEFRTRIDTRLRTEPRIRHILLDLADLDFLDSSGVGAVLGRYKKLKKREGRVAAVNMGQTVERIFSLSGLFNIVAVYDGEEEALGNLE